MVRKRGLILNSTDNVGNALEEVLPGETVELSLGREIISVVVTEMIPFGFKVAVKQINTNDPIIKYGETIGCASQTIEPGALVHVHNLAGTRGRGDLRGKA